MTPIGIQAVRGDGAVPGARSEVVTAPSSFARTLTGHEQQEAARAVLATLPAPIVYSLRDRAGSPADAVDRLFHALKDGSFTPPAGPLGRPDSIIGATAHAATLFETPAQLWDAMRTAIADPVGTASALRGAGGLLASPAAAGTPPAAERAIPEVRTLEDAERLLLAIRSGAGDRGQGNASTTGASVDWWEAALRFLLGARFPV